MASELLALTYAFTATGLIASGLIERTPEDRRLRALRVTSRRQALAAKASEMMLKHDERFTGSWPATERKAIAVAPAKIWKWQQSLFRRVSPAVSRRQPKTIEKDQRWKSR